MKKSILCAVSASVLVLAACSKSPESYLDQLEKLHNDYVKLMEEGKVDEAKQIDEKQAQLIEEMNRRMNEDVAFKAKVEELNGQTIEIEETNE